MKFYTTSQISENISETPEGYLVCLGVSIARSGEMLYAKSELPELEADTEGKIVVTRDPKEVFREQTVSSFEGKPITIEHPEDFASPENWKQLTKGILKNVRRGEGAQANDLVADLLITDKQAIELVKSGLREVSCGYDALYVQTGIGRASQSQIIGNHLALVDKGRAGAAYAIKDHKGKGSRMKISEKIKAIFAKAQDEAMKVADEAPAAVEEPKSVGYDDLMKAVKDLGEKVGALKPKEQADASTQPTQNEPAKVVAKDDEVAPSLEDRLKKLEELVAKLMEKEAPAPVADEESGEESEEVGDEECGDEEEKEEKKTGDTASRVEILVPGLKGNKKDIKVKALTAAYATADGKALIEKFTSGKPLDTKNAELVDILFIAVTDSLKAKRSREFAATKTSDSELISGSATSGKMTAEKINEMNAKRYAIKA